MSAKKADWRHYTAAAILVALLIMALWKRNASPQPNLAGVTAPAGSNPMKFDPNSP